MNFINFRVRLNILPEVLKAMGALLYFHFDIRFEEEDVALLDSCLLGVETSGGPRENPELASVLMAFAKDNGMRAVNITR
jgi:hypothetical protein